MQLKQWYKLKLMHFNYLKCISSFALVALFTPLTSSPIFFSQTFDGFDLELVKDYLLKDSFYMSIICEIKKYSLGQYSHLDNFYLV